MFRSSCASIQAVLATALPVGLLTLFAAAPVAAGEYRSIDGSGNNVMNQGYGQAGADLTRLAPAAYEDGASAPRGGASLPSARAISNAVAAQSVSTPNAVGASDWLWQWGQFLDHDLDLTPGGGVNFDIAVPMGDLHFDPMNSGTRTIELTRAVFNPATGTTNPREQVNEITSYIDGSNVYGSDTMRADGLRDMSGNGRLRMSAGDLLPFNTTGLDNDNGPDPMADPATFYVAGDIRVNEQIGLAATHTLFAREHNRLVGVLEGRLADVDDDVVNDKLIASGMDEDDFLYESARKLVGAQIQKVTYEEFLPMLLGSALSPSSGYDPTVDATVSNEFSGAAYRVGHTMLSSDLQLVDADLQRTGSVALRDAFFSPSQFQAAGLDAILGGLGTQLAQDIDTLVIDDVRNFLFGPPGAGGFDLASLNIQRGRDHGLASLNATRAELGLGAHASYLAMTGGDTELAEAFEEVYGAGNVDDVDLWIGGLAEMHVNGGVLGETFAEIISEQFTRSRDGDRFFYGFDLEHLRALDPTFDDTLLSDIILRNTELNVLQANVFVAVPEPASAGLFALAFAAACGGTRRRA